jgi:CheY-like chemotaxis protein
VAVTSFGTEQCLIFIFRDETQQDTIRRLSDNSAYKDKLMASVSHELRTPLNGNMNLIESAFHHPSTTDELKNSYLLPALRSGKLLMHIINDILDYSQMNANKLRLVVNKSSIKQTIQECLQLVQLQAVQKKIQLKVSFDEKVPEMWSTDHSRLSQIVLNLLGNAVKFTFQGQIEIKISCHNNDCLLIAVEDSGIGISVEDQQKLFKTFTMIDSQILAKSDINPKGVGLGLSISNALAKILGPTGNTGIKVKSTPGLGSTFSFYLKDTNQLWISTNKPTKRTCTSFDELSAAKVLKTDFFDEKETGEIYHPLNSFTPRIPKFTTHTTTGADSENKIDTLESTIKVEKSCKCPRILIVDDDCFNILALESQLKRIGRSANCAYNGQEAIDKIVERQNNPCGSKCKPYELVLMDCGMPVMDGFEASRVLTEKKLKGELENFNIVGCTAFTGEQTINECLSSGMENVITKPVNIVKLTGIVNMFLR